MAVSKNKEQAVTACDGLPVGMPGVIKRTLLHMSRFKGMTSPFGGGEGVSEGVNLSPRGGSEIATRLPRGIFMGNYGSGEPHGMVTFGGSLIFARGTGLYTTADGVTVHSLGTVSDTRKSFFIFGERLYVFPDKLYMEKGGMPKPLELDTGVISQAQFSGNTLTLPAGYSWVKNNPASRRIMTNIYNFQDLHEMGLYPCAYSMTFNVSGDTLNGILNQRSNDMLTANNWNVVQYAVLLIMMAQVSGLKAGELVHVIADAHIYDRHIPLVKEILEKPRHKAPKLIVDESITNFYDFTVDSFQLVDYEYEKLDKKIPVAI